MREKGEEIVQFLVNGGHIKIEQDTCQIEEFKELIKSCCFSENIRMEVIDISPFEKNIYFSYNLEERKIENSTVLSPFECGIILNWDEVKKLILNDENFYKKGEINMLKLLEIYKEKQTIEIESKYDEQLENLRKEDPVTVLKEQFEAAIKELLELKGEERVAICVTAPVVELTPETIEKQREITNIIREEKKKINRKIEEIEALLELAPNYEEKIKILRDYEIIDKKKNIIL